MTFEKEKTCFIKTDLSDLQGAWLCLRDSVINSDIFPKQERLIFHIDEAMSWESVRDLITMKQSLLTIRNIIAQSDVNEDVILWMEEVNISFEESLEIHKK